MSDLVCILLSVYNGARFLPAQLKSLVDQSHGNWVLHWRDDGSQDNSRQIMEQFADEVGHHRVKELLEPVGQVGITSSFMNLLSNAPDEAAFFAFCDQDDVWLPDKLTRAVKFLQTVQATDAGLYCARQMLVDENLCALGLSPKINRRPGLGNALVQNIATGCTIMMNKEARRNVISAPAPQGTLHDHWTYLVVCAVAGRVFFDQEPSILYRQHGGNAVGSQAAIGRRIRRALGRGPKPFLQNMANNLQAISAFAERFSAARKVSPLLTALQSDNPIKRLAALTLSGVYRQSMMEDFLMRIWVGLLPLPVPVMRLRDNDNVPHVKNEAS
jgi:glycosyltransferase involved in cell wall biosynthesis